MKNYNIDRYGVIHQTQYETFSYDPEYVKTRYDCLPDKGEKMAMLRAGYVIGACGGIHDTVCDVGYGNGAFLATMKKYGVECFGCDISGYPLPEGIKRVDFDYLTRNHFSLVTFFDSLEHMPNLDFVKDIDAEYMVITVPYCHYFNVKNGEEWMKTWKHLRPGEHIHHFNPTSLRKWLADCGWSFVMSCPVEDAIRTPVSDKEDNTFTAIFEKI